jgi:hypothetical protein
MVMRALILFLLGVLACAGPQAVKQPQAESWDLAFQAKALTVEQVLAAIGEKSMKLRACFQRERMSSDVLASYVFELSVGNDGRPPEIKELSTTNAKQLILSECLASVLRALRFLAHPGGVLRLKVPIESGS